MVIHVLGIGDTAYNIHVLRKFIKKSKIDHIQFKNTKDEIYNDENLFFDSYKVLDQVKQLNSIKKNYDLFLVTGWSGARLAYLTNMRFVWIFNGDDIRHPFFVKDDFNQKKIIKRFFYRRVFDSVSASVAIYHDPYLDLKKYNHDPILIHALVDTTLYNPDISSLNLEKKKFTFFSPTRISFFKGTDIIWNAIKACKNDFEVLQVNWYDEYPNYVKKKTEQLFDQKPEQVKLIPMIKKSDIGKFYKYSDAILGQMGVTGGIGGIEREAAACGKAVITYANPNYKYELNDEFISMPFIPKSKDPFELAKVIDMIVLSKQFRDEYAKKCYNFINTFHNPKKQAEKYDDVFENIVLNHKRQDSKLKQLIRKIFFILAYYLDLKKIINKLF